MGFYIQQHDIGMLLLEWLEENGHPISDETIGYFVFDNDDPLATVPVCWVDNGGFQAAGIAHNYTELHRFMNGYGGRPYKWFLVPKNLLARWLP